jgi:hypothetical protein
LKPIVKGQKANTMTDSVNNKNSVVYMIQAAIGPSDEPYPGAPVAIFYDYATAKTVFDIYEDPLGSLGGSRVIAFLTMSRINVYGILMDTHVCSYKKNRDEPEEMMSAWEAMRTS